jgi:hypothetical protein
MAAMAAMAAMTSMAVMVAVLSSTGIRDYGNRTIRRQDTFGTSTESSLAGVQDKFGSASCQHPRRTSCQHLRRSSDQHPRRSSGQHRHHQDEFGSTSASLGYVRSDFENRSTGGKAKQIDIQYGIWIVYEKWAGNGPRILGRCQQIETPGERGGWSATVRWVGFGQPETGGGNCGHESKKSVDSSTVRTRKLC